MVPKRKAPSSSASEPSLKKRITSPKAPNGSSSASNQTAQPHTSADDGVVQRTFYPPEMSNARCEQYNNNSLPRPLEELNSLIKKTAARREKIPVGECVVHWFKRDLRLSDNRALHLASEKAKSKQVPLVCMFIVSPQDYQAHLTSPARVDFELRTLEILKEDLAEKNIPLYITTIDKRREVPSHILQKCEGWGAKHVFCNIEYEVDELRRETKMTRLCLEKGIDFTSVHDDVIVPPETLMSGSGKQYSVYTPWWKAWVKHIHEHPHLLDAFAEPDTNPETAKDKFKDIFRMPIPTTPANKTLPEDDRKRLAALWPPAEHEAAARLSRFLAERISNYKDARNLPASNSTAMLSVHFSAGTLAARTAVREGLAANKSSKRLDAGNSGIVCWISEVAWRDFYKHVLAHWPFVCMHKPFKYEYSNIEWEYDDEAFGKWCRGETGFPIVDAAMRQLNTIGWQHNRCRMITACFLAKDLLLDWRLGERYFMEHLVDGDFASNNGGWGFSASTGVDPQPYFRIFNPLLQSEKFDLDGEYIRKWVPELAGIQGKAIHDPYGRGKGKEAEKAGYPKPMVEHKACRERALERYKEGLGRGSANKGGGVHN